MTAPDPGADPFLSPPLDGEQLALLRRYGQERPTRAGQVLFREGDRAYDFIVVLSGAVAVVDHEAGVVRELATLGPGRFVAELNILTGERVFATAVVSEPGSVSRSTQTWGSRLRAANSRSRRASGDVREPKIRRPARCCTNHCRRRKMTCTITSASV